jgi:Zn-finger nucleic acid-binding protein
MKCPVCKDVTLLMSEKRGVEIDYCPECRGIWLDRGELEKLVEKEEKTYRDAKREYDDYDEDKYDHKRTKKRKKESFLGEVFDIFGD